MIIFFCPTPDPENPAKFLPLGKAFDDCTIKFVPDLHLPKNKWIWGLDIVTDVKFAQNLKLAANITNMSFFLSETETDTLRYFITR